MRTLAVLAVLAGLAAAAYHYWPELTAPPATREMVFSGYAEGDFVHVATGLPGRLEAVSVKRGDPAAKGDVLFVLESDMERSALAYAEAQLRAAEATLADMRSGKRPPEIAVMEAQLAEAVALEKDSSIQLVRDLELFKKASIPKSQLDRSQALADANRAKVRELTDNITVGNLPEREMRIRAQEDKVAGARSGVGMARWAVDQKRAAAPADGRVYDVLYRVGEHVSTGQAVVRLLPPENIKIRFFVPEAALASIRIGQAVRILRDGAAEMSATVTYVAGDAEYTPPVIYSNESREKLCYLIEARPEPARAAEVHPGQPVRVRLP